MRTTLEIADETLTVIRGLARDHGATLGDTVNDVLRRGLGLTDSKVTVERDKRTGFTTISTGRPVSIDDVRSLEDDE